MKGGNVAMIEAALCLLESGTIPPKPVLLCFTADEEQDGTRARSMLDSKWVRAIEAGVFVNRRRAHRYAKEVHCGSAPLLPAYRHASDPDFAVNALDAAIDFYRAFCQAFDRGQYDPLLGHASVSLTQLHGGFMTNVIPGKANLELDIRLLPGQPTDDSFNLAQKIAEKLQNKEPRLKVELKVLNRNEANATPEDDPFIALVQQVCEACGSVPILGCPRFFTDAGRITPTLGIPFVIWGPGDR